MKRAVSLKCFVGNLDGQRQGLIVASSQSKAAAIAGCSIASFRDYWSASSKWPDQEIKHATLYSRPFNSAFDWAEGRCELLRK